MKQFVHNIIHISTHKNSEDNMKEIHVNLFGRTILNWETRHYARYKEQL